MRVVFRADASLDIGTGHIMRCLTLADALSMKGVECSFISRDLRGNLIEQTRQRGYTVHALPAPKEAGAHTITLEPGHAAWLGVGWQEDAEESLPFLRELNPDWLIVDHYALDSRWETATSQYWQRLFVIDDLADRAHVADLLLDQNLGREASDYKPLLPGHAQCLVGPQYALLRPEFAEFRPYSLERRKSGELRHILISLGGVDKDNATGAVLRALRECPLPDDCTMTVVMGGHAPHLQDVRTLAATMPWPTKVAINVSDMAKRMSEADLAIGAAGSTSWERCALGLPSILLCLADNQKMVIETLCRQGIAMELDIQAFRQEGGVLLKGKLVEAESSLLSMIKRAASITDGFGCVRLIDYLLGEK